MCIKHPEIKELLYEEEYCIKKCKDKIKEVENTIKALMNELNIKSVSSDYLS